MLILDLSSIKKININNNIDLYYIIIKKYINSYIDLLSKIINEININNIKDLNYIIIKNK